MLKQIVGRIAEQKGVKSAKLPLLSVRKIEFKEPNNAYIFEGEPIEILEQFDGKLKVRCFNSKQPIFTKPCSSYLIGAVCVDPFDTSIKYLVESNFLKYAMKSIKITQAPKTYFLAMLHEIKEHSA